MMMKVAENMVRYVVEEMDVKVIGSPPDRSPYLPADAYVVPHTTSVTWIVALYASLLSMILKHVYIPDPGQRMG